MAQILLVDDDLNLLQMVRLMLQRLGYEVITSRSGEEGLRLAAEMQPDLAIIDIMMPGLSGYDVVNQLRRDPETARLPVIILTARSQPMDKHKALRAGANAFISKPVTAQELAARVEAVLEAGVDFRVNTGLLSEPIDADLGPPPLNTGTLSRLAPPYGVTAPLNGAEVETPTNPAPPDQPDDQTEAVPGLLTPLVQLPLTVVAGLRGGTGSTTVAVNIACLLTSQGEQIALADLSAASGHVPLQLHLMPARNWGSLLHRRDVPDAKTVQGLLTPHSDTGIGVLAAPPVPSAETLAPPVIDAVLRHISASYEQIIADVPHLDVTGMAALRLARVIVLVMSDDPASVQTAMQAFTAFEQLGLDLNRVKVVLNHVQRARDIPAETIQKVIKQTLTAEIPFEPEQLNAIRRGIPLVSTHPDSGFTRAIQQLVRNAGL